MAFGCLEEVRWRVIPRHVGGTSNGSILGMLTRDDVRDLET